MIDSRLTLRGVRLAAGGRDLVAPFDCTIEAGAFVAIVGPNGVGKTTLLRALAGVERPAAGSVALGGDDIATYTPAARARLVAALGADTEAPNGMNVRDVALSGRFARRAWWDWARSDADDTAVEAALARVGLADAAERPIDSLSSGERQRAWIALALAQETAVMLLDEPTSHLDARYARDVLDVLRRVADDGTTVIAVLHDLGEASDYADYVAVFGAGALLAYDAPERALTPDVLERAYGIAFDTALVGGVRRVFVRDRRVALDNSLL